MSSQRLDGPQGPRYKNANLENVYGFQSGMMYLPVAENPPTDPEELKNWSPVEGVRAHADYHTRKVAYAAKKDLTPPIIPEPADAGAFKFVGGSAKIPHPKVNPNGTFSWSVAAEYFFVAASPATSDVGLVLGGMFDTFDTPLSQTPVPPAEDAPASVRQSGIGPNSGWALAKSIDLTNPAWSYSEPSYFPAQLFSADMINGAQSFSMTSAPPGFNQGPPVGYEGAPYDPSKPQGPVP